MSEDWRPQGPIPKLTPAEIAEVEAALLEAPTWCLWPEALGPDGEDCYVQGEPPWLYPPACKPLFADGETVIAAGKFRGIVTRSGECLIGTIYRVVRGNASIDEGADFYYVDCDEPLLSRPK